MIVTTPQHVLVGKLCEEIGYSPSPNMRCIGKVSSDRLVAVIGYDGFNGSSVMMHVWGEGSWIDRELLKVAFAYPFNVMGCKVVIGIVPGGNEDALRLNRHLGFKVQSVIEDGHPDGELVIMAMRREDCRYLPKQEPLAEAA